MPRLLIFEPRKLGDSILSLPFLRGAMEKFEVTVCCLPNSASIYRWILPPENIVEWEVPWDSAKPAREKLAEAARVIRLLRARKFDVVVSVWADTRYHLCEALIGAPQRLGYPMNPQNYYCWERPWRRKMMRIGWVLNILGSAALLRPLLTKPISKPDPRQSHLDCWRQMSKELDVPFRTEFPWFPVGEIEPDSVLDVFLKKERALNRKIWMVHPGARVASKQWPLAHFQQLADDFFPAQNCSLVVIHPPDAAPLQIHREHQLEYTAPDLNALVAAVARVDGIFCNDSMISHMAAALGKRVVSLFGPSQASWFAPYGSEEFVVSVDVCPHRPCMDHCVMPSPICIEQVDVVLARRTLEKALATQ